MYVTPKFKNNVFPPRYLLHKDLYINIHSGLSHNNSKLEITQMWINIWMDEQTGVHTYNGLYLAIKRTE